MGVKARNIGYNLGMRFPVAEAKNKLTELIRLAEDGEHVTITRHGHPCVDIVKSQPEEKPQRKFGVLGNKKVVLDPRWDEPVEDLAAWERGEA